MQVDIYYCRVCGLCNRAIDFFRDRGVTFTAHAVEFDPQADAFIDSANTRTMYERCGGPVDIVPQMFVGNMHIAGWKKLEPMIESGEIDTWVPHPARP